MALPGAEISTEFPKLENELRILVASKLATEIT
jgi:hypothetical protein